MNQQICPKPERLWRYRLCARIVMFLIALDAIEDTTDATNACFFHWLGRSADDMHEYLRGLEAECRAKGKLTVIAIAEGFEAIGGKPMNLDRGRQGTLIDDMNTEAA